MLKIIGTTLLLTGVAAENIRAKPRFAAISTTVEGGALTCQDASKRKPPILFPKPFVANCKWKVWKEDKRTEAECGKQWSTISKGFCSQCLWNSATKMCTGYNADPNCNRQRVIKTNAEIEVALTCVFLLLLLHICLHYKTMYQTF